MQPKTRPDSSLDEMGGKTLVTELAVLMMVSFLETIDARSLNIEATKGIENIT